MTRHLARPCVTLARCALLAAALTGCGVNYSAWTPTLFASPTVFTGDTELQLAGGPFEAGAVATWNGEAQQTTVVSPTELTVRLDPLLTAVSGSASVIVTNPNGYPSEPQPITIVDAQLELTALSPETVPVGAGALTVTLAGRGFRPASQVLWNGVPVPSKFGSSTRLTVALTAAMTAAGTALVTVQYFGSQFQTSPLLFTVGASELRVVKQTAFDLSEEVRGLLFFWTPPSPDAAARLTSLDPATGELAVLAEPGGDVAAIAVSEDGVYVGVRSFSTPSIVRYSPPWAAPAPAVAWSLAGFGSIDAMAVAPGAPRTVAVALSFGGLTILDDGAPRANAAQVLVDALEWGADASVLLGVGSFSSDVHVVGVDASGATLRQTSPSLLYSSNSGISFRSRLHFDPVTRLFYGDAGEIIDEHGALAGTFDFGGGVHAMFGCMAAVDGPGGKAFFACPSVSGGGFTTIRSMDLATRSLVATLHVPADGNGLQRLVRWGPQGLALATNFRILLVSGPFVR
jgi:hypothetical protein